jgi:hypothetical protein
MASIKVKCFSNEDSHHHRVTGVDGQLTVEQTFPIYQGAFTDETISKYTKKVIFEKPSGVG